MSPWTYGSTSITLGGCVFLVNPTNFAMNITASLMETLGQLSFGIVSSMKGRIILYSLERWDEKSATIGLMWRIIEPFHQVCKIVTHDNGFCVTAWILQLHNFNIYGQFLMEKWGRYWLCNVPSDFIDEHFCKEDIWLRESLEQTINHIDFFSLSKGEEICCKNHINSWDSEWSEGSLDFLDGGGQVHHIHIPRAWLGS